MNKALFILVFIFSCLTSYTQKDWDSIIVVHTIDTTNLFKRVKHAFINMDFIVKDLDNRDTLKTYPREFGASNSIIASAIIVGQNVIFKGIWGSGKLNYFGYSVSPRDYQRIFYYKNCIEWKILHLVAEAIGGEISYKK